MVFFALALALAYAITWSVQIPGYLFAYREDVKVSKEANTEHFIDLLGGDVHPGLSRSYCCSCSCSRSGPRWPASSWMRRSRGHVEVPLGAERECGPRTSSRPSITAPVGTVACALRPRPSDAIGMRRQTGVEPWALGPQAGVTAGIRTSGRWGSSLDGVDDGLGLLESERNGPGNEPPVRAIAHRLVRA
jgi:hypothetical protein